jgi:hypothetical protein
MVSDVADSFITIGREDERDEDLHRNCDSGRGKSHGSRRHRRDSQLDRAVARRDADEPGGSESLPARPF